MASSNDTAYRLGCTKPSCGCFKQHTLLCDSIGNKIVANRICNEDIYVVNYVSIQPTERRITRHWYNPSTSQQ
jgi:hypothetical protein